MIVIFQFGEIIDIFVVMREVKVKGLRMFGIVNVVGLLIVREVDDCFYIWVGFEIVVVLIKVYIIQLICFYFIVFDFVIKFGIILYEEFVKIRDEIKRFFEKVEYVLIYRENI